MSPTALQVLALAILYAPVDEDIGKEDLTRVPPLDTDAFTSWQPKCVHVFPAHARDACAEATPVRSPIPRRSRPIVLVGLTEGAIQMWDLHSRNLIGP